jgi:hypothetical protein
MGENQWDDKVKAFLKRTGEDLKKAGSDIRTEAEKLMKEVQEPSTQEKVKEGLKTFSHWARKTAEEVATVVETGMKRAETAVRDTIDTKPGQPANPPGEPATRPSAPEYKRDTPSSAAETMADEEAAAPPMASPESMRHDTPVDTPANTLPDEPTKKTIGKKKGTAKPKPSGAAKKPLGKKR